MNKTKGRDSVRLGSVCKTTSGGTPLKDRPEYYEGGTIPWLMSGEVSQGEVFKATKFITELGVANSSAKVFPPDTVLIAMYGATAGQVGILRFEATTNQAVCGILPNPHYSAEFLYYFFLSQKQSLIDQATGNAQPNISQQKIKDTLVPAVSAQEQRRIVALLDEAFARIAVAKANAEQNLKNARALFESHLNAIFTNPGPDWTTKRLEQVGRTQTGSTPKTAEKSNYGTYIPFVKPGDFRTDGTIDYENDGLSEIGAKGARIVSAGSVLMVCIGATIGKCGYSDKDITTNQQINSLTPNPQISNRFIYYQMLTKPFQERVLLSSGQATLPIINKSKWSALEIVMPERYQEQLKIAVQLDALVVEAEKLENIYERKLVALEELKKSLLHKAFSGEL